MGGSTNDKYKMMVCVYMKKKSFAMGGATNEKEKMMGGGAMKKKSFANGGKVVKGPYS